MSIYDNIRLASYSVAADAFDKSKDVFVSFVPLVESVIWSMTEKSTVSFLALQSKVNEIYTVNIPKDTLRYMLNILKHEGKIDFVQNKTIVPLQPLLSSDYIAKQESAKAAIESFFASFHEYLSEKDIFLPLSEVREQICNLIYAHSNELATFVQNPSKGTLKLSREDTEEWELTGEFVSYLLGCKSKNAPEYTSFVRLFDGAVQSTLLNFAPSKIKETVDKRFQISVAILDTNFILRLMGLQPELDNDAAYVTWQDLRNAGTKLIVLQQTIEETCSSIRGFVSEIVPYAQQAHNFLRSTSIRTSGFWAAFQAGKSRTDFYELSKEDSVRDLLINKFNIEIVEDFDDDSISQDEINSLIASKNSDRYGYKQAQHDLLLLSYCRKKRPRHINSIGKAEWWVLTNDRKLAYWNQSNSYDIQECITETQFSNLMWLQAKKDCDEGLSNTIVILASKISVGTDAISNFAERINRYSERYATDTSKLDDLSLVFASNALSSADIQSGGTDEDQFASLIARKVESIRQQQVLDQNERIQLEQINASSVQVNSELSRQVSSIKMELSETRRQARRLAIQRDIEGLKKDIETNKSNIEQLKELIEFSEKQIVPAARLVICCFVVALCVLVVAVGRFAYSPIYNWISKTANWADIVLNIISSGIIIAGVSCVYYFTVVLIWGSPYQPAELFNHLRDRTVHKRLSNYILEKDFPSEYSHINLNFQLDQNKREYEENRKQLIELQRQLEGI